MLARACAVPPKPEGPRLPKRLARARRVAESKRMDTLKSLHETVKKTAKEDAQFVADFFSKTGDLWKDDDDDDFGVEVVQKDL